MTETTKSEPLCKETPKRGHSLKRPILCFVKRRTGISWGSDRNTKDNETAKDKRSFRVSAGPQERRVYLAHARIRRYPRFPLSRRLPARSRQRVSCRINRRP